LELEFPAHAFGKQSYASGRASVEHHCPSAEIIPCENGKDSEDFGERRVESQNLGQQQNNCGIEPEADKGNYEKSDDLFRARETTAAENEAAAQQVIYESGRYEREHRCSEDWKLQWAQRNEARDVDTKTDSANNKIEPQLKHRHVPRRRGRDDVRPAM